MNETVLWEETIQPGASWSHVLKRGTALRLTDVEGGANVGGIFYNFECPTERYNMLDTLKAQHIVRLTSDLDVADRVVMRQIMPRVLNSIRLNLKAVMLFLFAGEMIASTDGLAYRIALLRRHMGMDVVIPYVLWVAMLLFLVDFGMRVANRKLHPWFQEA
jgi:ABC-type nitrate/sulfonate/bicarbonate transport system permease component